jgi:hypothetical protein
VSEEGADRADLAHLLTALVKFDRFDEGQLRDAFESGLLRRVAERAAKPPLQWRGA